MSWRGRDTGIEIRRLGVVLTPVRELEAPCGPECTGTLAPVLRGRTKASRAVASGMETASMSRRPWALIVRGTAFLTSTRASGPIRRRGP